MTETTIGYLAFGNIIALAFASLLYMLGGRDNKLWRRLGSAVILGSAVNITSLLFGIWELSFLLAYPCLIAGFSMGYSGDEGWEKAVRRLLYTIGVCATGLVFALSLGGFAWLILPLHIGVGAFSVWLGVKNPIHAAAEEIFICVLLNTGLLMYPFIK